MKFSIIVPVYLAEEYLDQCVKSVLEQSYKNFELILVDNASPDNCGMICEKYAQKDKRVCVYHRELNGRPAGARNTGLEIAEGEYILFLDSDDWMVEDTLLKLSGIIGEELGKDIYFATHYTYYDKTNRNKFNNGNYDNLVLSTEDGIKVLSNLLTRNFSWTVWRHVFRREMLAKNNIFFDEAVLGSEDVDFFIKAVLGSQSFYGCDIPLCYYRVGRLGSVISKKSNATIESNFIVSKRWYDFFFDMQKRGSEITCCIILKKRFANMFCSSIAMASTMNKTEKKIIKEYINENKYIIKDTNGLGHRMISVLYLLLPFQWSMCIIGNLYKLYKAIKSS